MSTAQIEASVHSQVERIQPLKTHPVPHPQIVGIVTSEEWNQETNRYLSPAQLKSLEHCQVVEFRGDTYAPEVMVNEYRSFISTVLEQDAFSHIQRLLTIRLPRDGGKWSQEAMDRLPYWIEFCKNKKDTRVDWLDIELEEVHYLLQDPKGKIFLKELQSSSIIWVLSHHQFHKGYSLLQYKELLQEMRSYGADAIKFAVSCQTQEEVENLLLFSKELSEKQPLSCVISMGPWGAITRVLSPLLGAPITYGFLGENPTVPGQVESGILRREIQKLQCMEGGPTEIKPLNYKKWITLAQETLYFSQKAEKN